MTDRVGGHAIAMPRVFRMMSIVGAMYSQSMDKRAQRLTWGCAEVAKSQGMKRSTHLRNILWELVNAGVLGMVHKRHELGVVPYSFRYYLKPKAATTLSLYVCREYPQFLDPSDVEATLAAAECNPEAVCDD